MKEQQNVLMGKDDDLRAKLDTNIKIINEYQNIIIPGYRERSERVEKERDNLQAQLKGITEARDTFYNDMVLYKKSCDDLIKLRDELFDKVDALTAERDNLQAQVGVLRETLGLVVADINMAQNPTCDSAAWLDLALSKINQVISITPAEARERDKLLQQEITKMLTDGCPVEECPEGDSCRRCWGKYLLGMLAK